MTWSLVDGRRTAWFATSSHAEGVALVRAAVDALPTSAPVPDADVRRDGVRVTLDDDTTADAVADAVADAANGLGLASDLTVLQRLSVVVEARDPRPVSAFWRTVTAYEPGAAGLVDPLRRDPSLRVVTGEEDRPLRVRLHLDVSRPHELGRAAAREVAPDRVPAGEEWPYFLNVADLDGNEADLVPLAPDDRFEDPRADDWRLVFGGKALYVADARSALIDLADEAARLADVAGLPLMIDLRDGSVVLDSGKDLWQAEGFADLAVAVQAAARALGASAEPDRLRFLQVCLDVVDLAAAMHFWRSVLGYADDPRDGVDDLVHPRLLDLPVMFQPMEADDTARRRQRGRMQLRLDVPADQAAWRVEKALAAGGVVLEADEAAGRWVLADPERNELVLVAGAGPD